MAPLRSLTVLGLIAFGLMTSPASAGDLNFQFNGSPALTLLLVGQAEILPQLARCPGLDERLDVKTLSVRATGSAVWATHGVPWYAPAHACQETVL